MLGLEACAITPDYAGLSNKSHQHLALLTLEVQQRQGRGSQATVIERSGRGQAHRALVGDAVWLEQGVFTLRTRRRVCVWRRWAQGRAEAWEPK